MKKVFLSLFLLYFLGSPHIFANPMDTYGWTSRAIGMGGGITGDACSYEATYYNPAGLAKLEDIEIGADILLIHPFLKINNQPAKANTTHILWGVGFGGPIPLGRGFDRRLFIAVGFLLPNFKLYTIRERPFVEPVFPFFQERNQRLVLNTGLGLRLHRRLSIGAGISLLPNVEGRVGVDFTQPEGANYTDIDVNMSLSANAGILVEVLEDLFIGVTWRGANRTHIAIPVRVRVSEKIAPVSIRIDAYDYSTPHQVAFGLSWRHRMFKLVGDFTYYFYRNFTQSSPTVYLYDIQGKISKRSISLDPNFRDAFAIRMGGEWMIVKDVAIRGGFDFITSPVPPQRRETNLLDGNKFGGSVGVGFDFSKVLNTPILLDLHLTYFHIQHNQDEKEIFIPENPGYPSIKGGGDLINGGISIRMKL